MAAAMRGRAKGRWLAGALAAMQASSGAAAAVLQRHGCSGCTDVTGFGLLGHLVEMARASGVAAALQLAAVPLLPGALECAAAGALSSLHAQNARAGALVGWAGGGGGRMQPAASAQQLLSTVSSLAGPSPARRGLRQRRPQRRAGHVAARPRPHQPPIRSPPHPMGLLATPTCAESTSPCSLRPHPPHPHPHR
jgi:hypothetical protein